MLKTAQTFNGITKFHRNMFFSFPSHSFIYFCSEIYEICVGKIRFNVPYSGRIFSSLLKSHKRTQVNHYPCAFFRRKLLRFLSLFHSPPLFFLINEGLFNDLFRFQSIYVSLVYCMHIFCFISLTYTPRTNVSTTLPAISSEIRFCKHLFAFICNLMWWKCI